MYNIEKQRIENINKQMSTKREYIKALKWFRGGSIQDNNDCFDYWSRSNNGWKMLNSYLAQYLKYTKEDR